MRICDNGIYRDATAEELSGAGDHGTGPAPHLAHRGGTALRAGGGMLELMMGGTGDG